MSQFTKDINRNTLRLNQRELQQLLELLDQQGNTQEVPEREFARTNYRIEAVQLTVKHNAGNNVTLPVATRNISRGGIAVLHSSFIHNRTPVEVTLHMPDGTVLTSTGKVVRCNHLTGRVHEIGIKFDQQISTRDLLGLDPLNGAYSLERVDPTRLHGSVLLVTTSDLDRDLILMYLEDTNLIVNTADSIENAIARAQRGCELIIADYHLGEETAPDLIFALNQAGCDFPVIVMTSDESVTVRNNIREVNASGILVKPIAKLRLLQAVAEFLHADGDGGPLYSTLTPENTAYPLLTKFLSEVSRMALNLETSVREDDANTCLSMVRALSGTAAPLGFPDISSLAIAAEKQLANKSPKGASTEIRALVIACRRIKARPAA